MIVQVEVRCPKCGEEFLVNNGDTPPVSSLGRKRLNIAFMTICDALEAYCSAGAAAEKLGCSRAYIYKRLGEFGTSPAKVLGGINREKYAELYGYHSVLVGEEECLSHFIKRKE